jgi:hypothetical protein
VSRLRVATGDPWLVSVVVLVATAAAGLGAIGLGWRGAAARVNVAEQVPFVVSGALGGIAVLGFSLGVLAIQSRRRAEARRRAELDRLADAIAGLTAAVRDAA